MPENTTYVLTFFSHYDAVQFSRRAKQQGFEANLMPVPRKISSSCGTGAQIALAGGPEALTPLLGEGVDKAYAFDGQVYTLCFDADDN